MAVLIQWLATEVRARVAARRAVDPERGATTVETVVIAAGWALLAIAVVAGITALVTGKMAEIDL